MLKRRNGKRQRAVFLGALAIPVLFPCAFATNEDTLPWEDARRFAEALETIRREYAESIDDATLIDNAIRGMAAGLDPYSIYLDPQEFEQARISALGRYEGIGVEVAREGDYYVIVTPFDGGPAERAGLLPGDRLLRADGQSLARIDPAELDALLHGETGSRVRLTLQRGDGKPFNVTLTRELVNIPSVTGTALNDTVAYVRIAQFSDSSATELAQVLGESGAMRTGARGIVLDLRNNAGGTVDSAVAIADLLLEEGVIVSTQGRAAGQTFEYRATPGDVLRGLPIVALVNSGTASAAEILAGALQDHTRATLLGSTTFGKGAVQSLIPLEGGGALRITTAHYRTPSGKRIEAEGVHPDVIVTEADAVLLGAPLEDPLVARARELLNIPQDQEQ